METKENFELLNKKLKSLDESIGKGNFEEGREIFDYLRLKLKTSSPSEEVKQYRKILAEKGYNLVHEAHKQGKKGYSPKNAEIINYYGEQFSEEEILSGKNNSSGLEKTITAVSLGSIFLGIAIGYPALTGNAIADVVKGSVGYGAALFFLGLLGVFIANKK
jgi:hypothetical protein